jgi:predicted dehydrogenase
MEQVGVQYDIPKVRQYTDYKELIDTEQPDIVSVATQPEHRAEIVLYAAEHGAKAIYAEKAMAASMAEADAMVEVCERNGVFFNIGTQRRWHPGFTKMRELIDSERLGRVKTIIFNGSTLLTEQAITTTTCCFSTATAAPSGCRGI